MQKIIYKKLKNNLEVEFIIDRTFTYSVISFMFGVGSFHDDKNLMGIAHLFEHMIGKRTKKFNKKSQAISVIDREGIEFNAFTYPEYTLYIHKQENKKIIKSLDLMIEILYNPKFILEDLEKEKKVVLQEGEQTKMTEGFLMWQELQKNLLNNDRLAYGTESTLGNITLNEFNKFYLHYKNLKNTKVLVAASDEKEMDRVINKLEKIKGDQSFSDLPIDTQISKVSLEKSNISFKGGENVNLVLGFDLGVLIEKENLVFMILNAILSHGLDSLLNKRLRDEMGLIYWADASNNLLGKDNIFTIYTNCIKDNLPIVETEILKILISAKKIINQKSISKIIKLLRFRILKSTNPESSILESVSRSVIGLKYLTPNDSIKLLEKITMIDVRNMVEKILKVKNKTRIVIN